MTKSIARTARSKMNSLDQGTFSKRWNRRLGSELRLVSIHNLYATECDETHVHRPLSLSRGEGTACLVNVYSWIHGNFVGEHSTL